MKTNCAGKAVRLLFTVCTAYVYHNKVAHKYFFFFRLRAVRKSENSNVLEIFCYIFDKVI